MPESTVNVRGKQQATAPLSSNNTNNILNYFQVYCKTDDNAFELKKPAIGASGSQHGDVTFLDDDDELMQAVPFLAPRKNNSTHPRKQTEIASSFTTSDVQSKLSFSIVNSKTKFQFFSNSNRPF